MALTSRHGRLRNPASGFLFEVCQPLAQCRQQRLLSSNQLLLLVDGLLLLGIESALVLGHLMSLRRSE